VALQQCLESQLQMLLPDIHQRQRPTRREIHHIQSKGASKTITAAAAAAASSLSTTQQLLPNQTPLSSTLLF
jgi:hypothetical protein